MQHSSVLIIHALLVMACFDCGLGKGMAGARQGSLRASLNSSAFHDDIRNAMDEALGCGGHMSSDQVAAINAKLKPVWDALPKVANGRIERGSLRYLAHRYFNSKSALMIRGFEPTRSMSQSDWGSADILSQRVPLYVERVLESQHAQEHGFSFDDAVRLVATLEELIWDSESTLLETVYAEQHKPISRSLTYAGLSQVLESYMVHWMLGGDEEAIAALMKTPKLREQTFPHWQMVIDFVNGRIHAMQYDRYMDPRGYSRLGHNALAPRYSFEDAHRIVGDITKSFATFWDSECRSMTSTLVDMDTHNTGRVPLSKFYASNAEEWRFGESEAYLRELGALDETSSWVGKQVIIANYIQAASNCIVSAPHYLVCCVNTCEEILGEVEVSVGSPMALPENVLSLVGNMTSQTSLDREEKPNLSGALTTQLQQIADAHGGTVPLHGRLFAQWLHYAFPRECPFPHRSGQVGTSSPYEYGEEAIATNEEMATHSSTAETDVLRMTKDEEQWMSQWSSEEELIASYGDSRSSVGSGRIVIGGAIGFGLLAVLGLVSTNLKGASHSKAGLLPMHGKAHFV